MRWWNAMFFSVGMLFVGLAIPLIMEKIEPNGVYGFRTGKTLSSPEIWYEANRIAGIDMAIAGGAIMMTAVALFFMGKNYSMVKIMVINGIAVLGFLAAAVTHSAVYLSKL